MAAGTVLSGTGDQHRAPLCQICARALPFNHSRNHRLRTCGDHRHSGPGRYGAGRFTAPDDRFLGLRNLRVQDRCRRTQRPARLDGQGGFQWAQIESDRRHRRDLRHRPAQNVHGNPARSHRGQFRNVSVESEHPYGLCPEWRPICRDGPHLCRNQNALGFSNRPEFSSFTAQPLERVTTNRLYSPLFGVS